jgi:hypothetical protein
MTVPHAVDVTAHSSERPVTQLERSCLFLPVRGQPRHPAQRAAKSQQRAKTDNPEPVRLTIVELVISEEDDVMGAIPSTTRSAKPSLQAMLVAAYHVDPSDQLIAPVGAESYSTVFSLIPAALAVLRVAAEIEPDPADVMRWYRQTRIAELGYLTAVELVSLGRTQAVIDFLSSVRDGQRD